MANVQKTALKNRIEHSKTVKFVSENPDIRFSFAGPVAVAADKYALGTATMRLDAGENAETVRRETGWFRGADKKMRFEISDKDAKLKIEAYKGHSLAPEAAQWVLENDRGLFLGDLLDHPALFAAYPDLTRYPVSFFPRDVVNGNAAILRKNIWLANDMGSRESLSSLLHEIQHAIQNIEGFASGGSPNSIREKDVQIVYAARKEEALAQYRAADAAFRKNKTPENRRRFESTASELERVRPAPDLTDDNEVYRRLAGEVEARNTQARQTMSDAERRTTSPDATADLTPSPA